MPRRKKDALPPLRNDAAPEPTTQKRGRYKKRGAYKTKAGYEPGTWGHCNHCDTMVRTTDAVMFRDKRYHAMCFGPWLEKIVKEVRVLFPAGRAKLL